MAYFLVRSSDPTIAKNSLLISIIITAVIVAVALAIYLAYLGDMNKVRERLSIGKVAETSAGPIEYADVGQGQPILSIHGAGGGFDQGLRSLDHAEHGSAVPLRVMGADRCRSCES